MPEKIKSHITMTMTMMHLSTTTTNDKMNSFSDGSGWDREWQIFSDSRTARTG